MKYATLIGETINLIKITEEEAKKRPDVIMVHNDAKTGDRYDISTKKIIPKQKEENPVRKIIKQIDKTKLHQHDLSQDDINKLVIAIADKLDVIRL